MAMRVTTAESPRRLHIHGQSLELGSWLRDCIICAAITSNLTQRDYAGQVIGNYPQGSPALAVEVISKSNTADAMQRKIRRYFEHGAREVWLFYPRTQAVFVHRDMAVEITGALTTDLFPASPSTSPKSSPRNPDAYDLRGVRAIA